MASDVFERARPSGGPQWKENTPAGADDECHRFLLEIQGPNDSVRLKAAPFQNKYMH
jgi:hypothetical protein